MTATQHRPVAPVLGGGPLNNGQQVQLLPFLIARQESRHVAVPLAQIESIQAAGNLVTLHHPPQQSTIRTPLTVISSMLPMESYFLRVHRSIIINLMHLTMLEPSGSGDFVLTLASGAQVPSGRVYRPNVVAMLRNRHIMHACKTVA